MLFITFFVFFFPFFFGVGVGKAGFKELCHGGFKVFRSKLPQLETMYLCHIRNAYRKLTGIYRVNYCGRDQRLL